MNYNYDFHDLQWPESAGIFYILVKPATSHYIIAQKSNFYVSIRSYINYNARYDKSEVTIVDVASNLLQF